MLRLCVCGGARARVCEAPDKIQQVSGTATGGAKHHTEVRFHFPVRRAVIQVLHTRPHTAHLRRGQSGHVKLMMRPSSPTLKFKNGVEKSFLRKTRLCPRTSEQEMEGSILS